MVESSTEKNHPTVAYSYNILATMLLNQPDKDFLAKEVFISVENINKNDCKSIKYCLKKRGKKADLKLKSLLNRCAITAIRYDPELKAYYERKTGSLNVIFF